MAKRYYWLKLKRDFFKRHDIRIIEAMPNGKDYILFYLKLLLESVDHDGALRFSDTIPYNEEMLSVVTNTNVDIVRSAMKLFTELEMVDVLDEGTIFMNEVQALIGSAADNDNANRQRRFREKRKALALPERYEGVTKSNESKSKSIEKELEIDRENIEPPSEPPAPAPKATKHKFGEFKKVRLTSDERQKLEDEYGKERTQQAITFLDEYIEMKGYKAKSHYLAIKKWVFDALDEAEEKRSRSNKGRKEIVPDWAKKDDTASRLSDVQRLHQRMAQNDPDIAARAKALQERLTKGGAN